MTLLWTSKDNKDHLDRPQTFSYRNAAQTWIKAYNESYAHSTSKTGLFGAQLETFYVLCSDQCMACLPGVNPTVLLET